MRSARVKELAPLARLSCPCPFSTSTTIGPPTTTLTVSGSGFGGAEGVDIYFDTTDEALAGTDGSGSFSAVSITVPSEAKTVQVILGSADADKLGWGNGRRLFYAIKWGGVCVRLPGRAPGPLASPHPPTCSVRTWGTAIDAKTGAFIVGGTDDRPPSRD